MKTWSLNHIKLIANRNNKLRVRESLVSFPYIDIMSKSFLKPVNIWHRRPWTLISLINENECFFSMFFYSYLCTNLDIIFGNFSTY